MKASKTSADYVREFRERMRRAGLVKKDVWIRPEYAEELSAIEKRFRLLPGEKGSDSIAAGCDSVVTACWSVSTLESALRSSPLVQSRAIDVARAEGADTALSLVMREYGDLPIFVAVGGLQIVVQALMWPVDHVVDPAAFNAHVLRTHKLVPLTTMGIEPVAGVPCYIMFGSLDTQSSLANIVFEIETLAGNVIEAVDNYRAFLKDEVLPQDEALA